VMAVTEAGRTSQHQEYQQYLRNGG
jgi:hypothetical protein